MAAEHLLDRGFRQFAYCGFYNISWSDERGESFAKRIAEAGFKTNFYKPQKSKNKRLWENEQPYMVDWIKLLPKPLGLMACNDERGHNVIESCKIAGLDVPSEIAIIGVDNDELVCDLSDPPMTSISLNNEKAGYEATELLHKLMRDQKIGHQEITVQPKYVVTRQSTDILAIEDRDVAKAVQFIQQHIQDNLQVSDVVDAVALSRRSLERKFRSVLGHSVHDEIKNLHINLFSTMLIETHLSISQIATSLGLSSFKNISRYFRQRKGLSPLAYRKKYQIPFVNESYNNH
jgi:LacI family transcriptional regulator